jgi:hypothetical protein
VLILLVLPVLIDLFSKRRAWVEDAEEAEEPLPKEAKRAGAEAGDG